MHIEFKHVVLHNFISFGHSELFINDDGFIKVSGINENTYDLAISNGSGKSSLWESIVWAITGETIRGTKQVSNIYGEDGTYVELDFNIDSKNFVILRSKDHKQYKTNLKITIDGKDVSGKGIRDSEKLLSQMLPDITSSLIGSVIILGQGLPQRFTNNTPSGRKEVLEKLSKSDFMIEDLKNRVTERKTELLKVIRSHSDAVITSESKVSVFKRRIEECRTQLNVLNKELIEHEVSEYTQKLYILQKDIEDLSQSFNIVDAELSSNMSKIYDLNTKHTEEVHAVENKYTSKIDSLNNSIYELKGSIYSSEAELSKLESIKDICPTCGQKLPDVVKPDTTSLKDKLNMQEMNLLNLCDQLSELKNNKQEELNNIEHSFKDIYFNTDKYVKQLNLEKNNLSIKLKNKNIELSALQNKLNECKEQLNTVETKYSYISNSIEEYQKSLDDENEILLYNITQKDLQQSHLDVINKFETTLKRDFRGYLLSNVINYIEDRAKFYSRVIFETDKLSFKLNGNNIDISYMNKSYENLSGGEKQKVDIIIQFSIRDMLCSTLDFTSNILVLDEVFDGLDMTGCQKVLDVISSLTDIRNIFIVTHRKDLSIPCDKELIVVKSQNGFSEIR